MDNYLTVKELAEKLRYNQQYVRRLIRNGHIQAFKLGRGPSSQFRILESEVERLREIGFGRTLEALKKKIMEDEQNRS